MPQQRLRTPTSPNTDNGLDLGEYIAPSFSAPPACGPAPSRACDGEYAVVEHDLTWFPNLKPGRPKGHSRGGMDYLVHAERRIGAKAISICRGCPALEECRADVKARERGKPYSQRDRAFIAGMGPRERWWMDQVVEDVA